MGHYSDALLDTTAADAELDRRDGVPAPTLPRHVSPIQTRHGSQLITYSDLWCCARCRGPVALVFLPSSALAYECETCGKAVSQGCEADALDVLDDAEQAGRAVLAHADARQQQLVAEAAALLMRIGVHRDMRRTRAWLRAYVRWERRAGLKMTVCSHCYGAHHVQQCADIAQRLFGPELAVAGAVAHLREHARTHFGRDLDLSAMARAALGLAA